LLLPPVIKYFFLVHMPRVLGWGIPFRDVWQFLSPYLANCQVVYSNFIMSVYHLQQLFLNKWLLSQTSIPINIANIAQTLGMECRRPKYGMVCRLLESCQAKSTFIENKRIFCSQDDTRSRLHGQCMVMPVPNFDWLEFEERAHPLLWARGHSSTSITSGKIAIYCLMLFKKCVILTFWSPSSFSIFSLKYSIFVIIFFIFSQLKSLFEIFTFVS
jgi:hypothetical protein